jgi:predicted PurR-regulated permease PerM
VNFLPLRVSIPEDGRPVSALRRDISLIKICVAGLLVLAALTGGVAAGGILAPTAIAVVLALVLAPVAYGLERLGFAPVLAAFLAVGVTLSIFVVGGLSLAPSATAWFKNTPHLVYSIEKKLRPIKNQIAAVESASQKIANAAAPAPAHATTVVEPAPSLLTAAAATAPNILAEFLYVAVLTVFLLADRKRYTRQLILTPRRFVTRMRIARICRDVQQRVSGYLFVMACINVGQAALIAGCFVLAGIADPILWGLAYAVLNFIPIIGPTAVVLAALAVGFATGKTLLASLMPAAILLGLNTIEAYFVQPWLLSRRIVVSPIAIFVMVATLVWMWGVGAAITAVPILILIHAVMVHVPSLRPFAELLATEEGMRGIRRRRVPEPAISPAVSES